MQNSKAILKTPGTMTILPANMPVPKDDEVLIKVLPHGHRQPLLE